MSKIVCATRGGEGSRAVQLAAIQLAKSTEKNLIFLFVIDSNSLGDVDDTLIPSIEEELDWMGKTLLRVAQQRAQQADLEAEVVIRTGEVRQEICDFLQASKADLLLLGAPRGTTANQFGDDAIEQFAITIQETTQVPVKIVRPDAP